MTMRAWGSDQNTLMLRHSSRSRPLNDSMKGLRHGSPGGINSIPVRVPAHSANAPAIISGPFSSRSPPGATPGSVTMSSSSLASRSAVMDRFTRPPRHSRVCSSTADKILIGRPSVVESYLEIDRPHHIWCLRRRHREMSRGSRSLAAVRHLHAQALLAPQPLNLLVVNHPTLGARVVIGAAMTPAG